MKKVAASLILLFVFAGSSPLDLAAEMIGNSATTAPRSHACCQGGHAHGKEQSFHFVKTGMPCGGEHPCCAVRTPVPRQALPAGRRNFPASSDRLSLIEHEAPAAAYYPRFVSYLKEPHVPFAKPIVLRI